MFSTYRLIIAWRQGKDLGAVQHLCQSMELIDSSGTVFLKYLVSLQAESFEQAHDMITEAACYDIPPFRIVEFISEI